MRRHKRVTFEDSGRKLVDDCQVPSQHRMIRLLVVGRDSEIMVFFVGEFHFVDAVKDLDMIAAVICNRAD